MDTVKLYRKRYIPNELILLEDDIILEMNENYIVTKWNVLKPRKSGFTHGYSLYCIKENFKISKFYDFNDNLIHTYCDIIETFFDCEKNEYIFNDLLADVIIKNDKSVQVLDLSELPEALEENLITIEQLKLSLITLDNLLNKIYDGKFGEYENILIKHLI